MINLIEASQLEFEQDTRYMHGAPQELTVVNIYQVECEVYVRRSLEAKG